MPLCVETSFPRLDASEAPIQASEPPRVKLLPRRRLCCRPAPYQIRDGVICRTILQQLRAALEKEYLSSTTEGTTCSLVSRLPLAHQSQLTTLASLLSGYSQPELFSYDRVSGGVNKCRDCQSFTLYSLLCGFDEQEHPVDIEKFTPTSLHVACLLPHPAPLVSRLVLDGTSVLQTNQLGQTPLHALLLGDVRSSSVVEALQILLCNGASVSCRDACGETPLLYVRNLLREGLYQRAAQLASILLAAGASVDETNNEGRNLLSYSLQHLDEAKDLTTTLLNHAASVWGPEESSPFTWLFKAVMNCQKIEKCRITLRILCNIMSRHPQRMKEHVIKVMLRQARFYMVYHKLYKDVQTLTMPFWSEPQRLTQLCRHSIRESLQPSKIHSDAVLLGLPQSLTNYILLQDMALGEN